MPQTVDPATFRSILGYLPTGIVIVAANAPEGPVGMSCNSFTSVSLSPPLVSVCAAESSTTWPSIRRTGEFCVSILASHHAHTCRTFAQRGVDRFAEGRWHERARGPGLYDAAAWIDCEIEAEHEAGDHWIVVARVVEMQAHDFEARPLVFYRGRYGSFASA